MSIISCILCPPRFDYYYMFQRPQQLMKAFSELKIPTYFMNHSYLCHKEAGIDQLNPYLHILNHIDIHPYLTGIRPVVYFSSPNDIDTIEQYNPSLVIFDSVDNPTEEFSSWQKHYYRALRLADVVLASSDKLYEQAAKLNFNSHMVPNACDYEHFNIAVNRKLPVPEDMKNINSPIIGYIGAIATWCDLQLVELLAENFPYCNIVMVGPLFNVSRIALPPNIYWLGMKPYPQLPYYLQRFDVGIIPFKLSSMVEAVNPIKMWEYMAAGIPVVTTAIPEAAKYPGLVLFSETGDAFMENVKTALHQDNPALKSQRMDLARNNSWMARARQIVSIMDDELVRKGIYAEQQVPTFPPMSQRSSRLHCVDISFKESINIDLRGKRRPGW